MKNLVVFIQLGSPKSPKVGDVRVFLREFLGDPRVVDLNPFIWKIILNLFVLPLRPFKSAQAYGRIWDGKQFPLVSNTIEFAKLVDSETDENIIVEPCFLIGSPSIKDVLDKHQNVDRIVAIPMFPQYSESTSASCWDQLTHAIDKKVFIPEVEFVNAFHRWPSFIDGSVKNIVKHCSLHQPDHLVISFHGLPTRRVLYKGDRYEQDCLETFYLLQRGVREALPQIKMSMAFQSRFGSEEWLLPATDAFCLELIEKGDKKLAVYCPSFVADCLETIDEIGIELKEEVEEIGGKCELIPCLNDQKDWAKNFGQDLTNKIARKPHIEKEIAADFAEERKKMPVQELKSAPLSDNAKSTIKIVFLTLFLDLVGFSIIFPLFPALAKHYLQADPDNYFLKLIFGTISGLTDLGSANIESIVLFGGALGALYSLLQFIAAPIWGSLSDRVGRRPILLVSIAGLALSYGMWIFAGSFTVLILARFFGGIMGGNISTATAVIADVTERSNRSKGMAFVGIAFATGFIIGPAMGGIFSLIDLTSSHPAWAEYGINPFSVPAIIAFVLSAINFVWVAKKFKETLPKEKRGNSDSDRSFNPLVLFKPLPYPGVNLTNFGHFLFLLAFSGMEFTLTFLAVERLNYTSLDNAYFFIFIGVVIALVQGGYVRRKAFIVGEKNMALRGLALLVPGLLFIAWAKSSWALYAGLFFLAVGSSLIIPCLTSLVSIYTPDEYQGKSVGIFRSLGALARVIGPIAASLMYWKCGSAWPYIAGAIFLIIPLGMVAMLPKPDESVSA